MKTFYFTWGVIKVNPRKLFHSIRVLIVRMITGISISVLFLGLAVDWDYIPDTMIIPYIIVMGLCLGWLVLVGKVNGWFL